MSVKVNIADHRAILVYKDNGGTAEFYRLFGNRSTISKYLGIPICNIQICVKNNANKSVNEEFTTTHGYVMTYKDQFKEDEVPETLKVAATPWGVTNMKRSTENITQ